MKFQLNQKITQDKNIFYIIYNIIEREDKEPLYEATRFSNEKEDGKVKLLESTFVRIQNL